MLGWVLRVGGRDVAGPCGAGRCDPRARVALRPRMVIRWIPDNRTKLWHARAQSFLMRNRAAIAVASVATASLGYRQTASFTLINPTEGFGHGVGLDAPVRSRAQPLPRRDERHMEKGMADAAIDGTRSVVVVKRGR